MRALQLFLLLAGFYGTMAFAQEPATQPIKTPFSNFSEPVEKPNPLYPYVTPEGEAFTQKMRVEERKTLAAEAGGFTWIPWSQAGKKVHEIVLKQNPAAAPMIDDGRYVDVAIADVDWSNGPDILVNYWNLCTAKGCPYEIYYDTPNKRMKAYFANTLTQYQKGVMVDDGYFKQ